MFDYSVSSTNVQRGNSRNTQRQSLRFIMPWLLLDDKFILLIEKRKETIYVKERKENTNGSELRKYKITTIIYIVVFSK